MTGPIKPPTLSADLSSLMSGALCAAKREGLGHADAEDIAATTLLRYWESASEVRHPRTWVLLVARRYSWLLRRSRQRSEKLLKESEWLLDSETGYSESIETRLDLVAALASLPQAEQEAILSCYVEGEGLETVSLSLGLSPSTTKRRLRSGSESLRRAITGQSLRRYRRCDATTRLEAEFSLSV